MNRRSHVRNWRVTLYMTEPYSLCNEQQRLLTGPCISIIGAVIYRCAPGRWEQYAQWPTGSQRQGQRSAAYKRCISEIPNRSEEGSMGCPRTVAISAQRCPGHCVLSLGDPQVVLYVNDKQRGKKGRELNESLPVGSYGLA